MYKLAIFDFDGTLSDTFPWFARVFDRVAEKFEFERRLDPAELEKVRALDSQQLLRHFGVPLWKLPAIVAHMRTLIADSLHEVRLFPGTPGFLRALHDRGVVIGIVSSNAAENVRGLLGPDVAPLVRHYDCGASLFGKAAKLKRILRLSGIPPDEAIYVGDEIRDVLAAREAKIASGAVTWGFNTADALRARSPTELFESFDEALERIAG